MNDRSDNAHGDLKLVLFRCQHGLYVIHIFFLTTVVRKFLSLVTQQVNLICITEVVSRKFN